LIVTSIKKAMKTSKQNNLHFQAI